jgi:hypothetical protein
MTAAARARRVREVAPGPGLRFEPAEERGALAVLDRARSHCSSKLRLGDRAGDHAETGHRHAAVRCDLRERSSLQARLELVARQTEGTGHTGVEGTAHAPHPDCSGSAGGRHTETLTAGCLNGVRRT